MKTLFQRAAWKTALRGPTFPNNYALSVSLCLSLLLSIARSQGCVKFLLTSQAFQTVLCAGLYTVSAYVLLYTNFQGSFCSWKYWTKIKAFVSYVYLHFCEWNIIIFKYFSVIISAQCVDLPMFLLYHIWTKINGWCAIYRRLGLKSHQRPVHERVSYPTRLFRVNIDSNHSFIEVQMRITHTDVISFRSHSNLRNLWKNYVSFETRATDIRIE